MIFLGQASLGVVLLICFVLSDNVDHPDRVINLPGAPLEPIFPLYAGFLEVSENDTQHNMFYVLAEAIRVDPSEAPLLVWLNGGPGASSLFGLFLEHGPYLIDANTGQLNYNDFSWNQYANVLYIESPSGVGFSYSSDNSSEIYDDIATARINRKALQDFMTRVHPTYANRDFYLSGESYAGFYIPHLAREILNHDEEFINRNFKGIAMINALVDMFSSGIATTMQLLNLGMIPQKHGEKLFKAWNEIINSSKPVNSSEYDDIEEVVRNAICNLRSARYDFTMHCNRIENDTMFHISNAVNSAECSWQILTETYLNRDDVQMALHVRTKERQLVYWQSLNSEILNSYEREQDTIPLYKDIVSSAQPGFRILYFTGDTDLMCPPIHVAFGAERIAKTNNMKVALLRKKNKLRQNWKYLGDFGGMRTTYYTGYRRNPNQQFPISMDVLTVRGAGHMIPMSVPDRAFQIINNFIAAKPGVPVNYSKKIPRK